MIDFKLTESGDLKIENGKIQITNDIAQAIKIRLKTFLGEWFLDVKHGVPYFQSILGKRTTKENIDSIIKKEILHVKNVKNILNFKSNIDNRVYEYTACVQVNQNEINLIKGKI